MFDFLQSGNINILVGIVVFIELQWPARRFDLNCPHGLKKSGPILDITLDGFNRCFGPHP